LSFFLSFFGQGAPRLLSVLESPSPRPDPFSSGADIVSFATDLFFFDDFWYSFFELKGSLSSSAGVRVLCLREQPSHGLAFFSGFSANQEETVGLSM